MIVRSLLQAWPGLAAIGGGVGLVLLFGRPRPEADEHDQHDVSDYHEPAPVAPSFSFTLAERGLAQMRADLADDDILPPAPPGMNAGSPLYAATLFAQWFPEDPDAVAARWLREIAAVEVAR